MLKITIIQVGKTKSPQLEELILEFEKRLSSAMHIEQVTVKAEDDLWKAVPDNAYTIALEVEGKTLSSQAFAQLIETRKNQGDSHLVFLIGPPDGFTDYQKEVNLKLSLSQMTFSHQTIRLILFEQLYRAQCILDGKPFAMH